MLAVSLKRCKSHTSATQPVVSQNSAGHAWADIGPAHSVPIFGRWTCAACPRWLRKVPELSHSQNAFSLRRRALQAQLPSFVIEFARLPVGRSVGYYGPQELVALPERCEQVAVEER